MRLIVEVLTSAVVVMLPRAAILPVVPTPLAATSKLLLPTPNTPGVDTVMPPVALTFNAPVVVDVELPVIGACWTADKGEN